MYTSICLSEYPSCKLGDSLDQCPGSFWAFRAGRDPSDSESSHLHVDIFRVRFHAFEAYSIDSSEMIGKSPQVSNFNRLFLKPTGSSVTNRRYFPDIGLNLVC